MSSSTSGSDVEADLLDGQLQKALEQELAEAAQMMADLPVEEKGAGTSEGTKKEAEKKSTAKRVRKAPAPKMAKAEPGVQKKAGSGKRKQVEAVAKEPPAKKSKVVKAKAKKAAKMDDSTSSSEETNQSSGTDVDSSSDQSGDESETDIEKKKEGKKDKYKWIKTPGSEQRFGQCRGCQQLQKQAKCIVQTKLGIFARVIQCAKCLEGNAKVRQTAAMYFKTVKKNPPEAYDFLADSDDYKATSAQYQVTTGQCSYCQAKQNKLTSEEMVKKAKSGGYFYVQIALCASCVIGNKQLQTVYWKAFSTFTAGGYKQAEEKKRAGKRYEEESSSDDNESEAEESKKKKRKAVKKKHHRKQK